MGLEAADYLRDRSYKSDGENLERAVVKVAFFQDPDGNDLYLCEST